MKVTGMNGTAQEVMRLPGALDLAAAEGFLETIRQHLKQDQRLRLDAADVETLTLPCVQIIMAAVAAHDVSVVNPSVAFSSAFRDLALDWNTGGAADDRRRDDVSTSVEPTHETEPACEAATSHEPQAADAPAPASEPMSEPEHETESIREAAASQEPQAADAPAPANESMREPAHETESTREVATSHEPQAADAPALANEPTHESGPSPRTAADEPEPPPAPDQAQGTAHVPAPTADKVVEQEPIHAPTDGPSMSKRILTIDDSKTMRDMLLMTLEEAGFDVLQAVDGQDGLDVLGKERVDVVITDINMPIMDGYEVIRNLRKNPVHKTTPILVLTTESDAEKKVIARDAGATGWMVKPFDPDRLIATIRKVAP
jgi:two-component system chemotaxis response regulator CheY